MATQHAILHAATRIIRRLSTEEEAQVAPDEVAVPLATPIDLSGGFWKLSADNQTKITASEQEIIEARVDPTRERQRKLVLVVELRASFQDAVGDPTLPAKLRRILEAWSALLS